MNRKQLTAGALVACNVLSSGAIAFASEPVTTQETTVAGQGADVAALLTAEAAKFSVTVPTGLPINVLANGQVVVSNEAYVENNSAAPIEIADVTVNPVETWDLVGMDTNYTDKQVDLKEFGMEIFDADTAIENSFVAREVGVKEKLIVDYDAIVAPQTKAQNEKVADAIFTVGWVGEEAEDAYPAVPENVLDFYSYTWDDYNSGYRVSLNNNFKTALTNVTNYTVDDKVVWYAGDPMPNPGSVYEGEKVTNVNMFTWSSIPTLDLSNFDTSNVTSMSMMFYNTSATTIDVSNFDTSNVTSMHAMFENSKATTLDLSSFDTSNVTDMFQMFHNSSATTLDLSSFDTSNITNMSGMFKSSSATTIDLSNFNMSNVEDISTMFDSAAVTQLYVGSEEDATLIKASYGFPTSTCTVTVK